MAALNQSSQRWRAESGAELIEFALVFPLLLFVVLGIIDFGFLFQRYEVVTNAAREGARIAVLPPPYQDDDVRVRVNQYLTAGGLTAPVTPTIFADTVNLGGACIVVKSVTVAYPHTYSFVAGIASYFGSTAFTAGTLQATAAMRSEIPATAVCPIIP